MMQIMALSLLVIALSPSVGGAPNYCQPGYWLKICNDGGCCKPVSHERFNEKYNCIAFCTKCTICKEHNNMEYKRNCSSTNDAECTCKNGYYMDTQNDFCIPSNNRRPRGELVSTPGTSNIVSLCGKVTQLPPTSGQSNASEERRADSGKIAAIICILYFALKVLKGL